MCVFYVCVKERGWEKGKERRGRERERERERWRGRERDRVCRRVVLVC